MLFQSEKGSPSFLSYLPRREEPVSLLSCIQASKQKGIPSFQNVKIPRIDDGA
jgi:hypothetical protein